MKLCQMHTDSNQKHTQTYREEEEACPQQKEEDAAQEGYREIIRVEENQTSSVQTARRCICEAYKPEQEAYQEEADRNKKPPRSIHVTKRE